jgi:hypothetical protein
LYGPSVDAVGTVESVEGSQGEVLRFPQDNTPNAFDTPSPSASASGEPGESDGRPAAH